MTWEIDIIQRAGRLIVSGEFRIRDAAEATTFLARFNEMLSRAGITIAKIQEPLAPTTKGGRAPNPMPKAQPERPSRPRTRLPDEIPQSVELTHRQRQIHKMHCAGRSHAQISEKLGVGVNTVSFHLARVRGKLRGETY